MVLLRVPPVDPTPPPPADAALRPSKSTSILPPVGRTSAASAAPPPDRPSIFASSAKASGGFEPALGLGPSDRSLLPDQLRQRRMKHVSCQTSATELADLRQLQEQLFQVRQELGSVNQELAHAERRLRHEVREEMEERVRKFEKRTMEKVAFLRQRQENSVNLVRKASKAQVESHKAHTEGTLKAEHDRVRASEEAEYARMVQQLEQRDLLIAGYKRENRELREQIERIKDAPPPPGLNKGKSSTSAVEVAEQTASLEAALMQRDATIKALRDQLARVQHGLPPTAGAPPTLSQSQSVPVVGAGQAKTPGGAKSASKKK